MHIFPIIAVFINLKLKIYVMITKFALKMII